MPTITYINGRYLHHAHATIPVEDRGFQFADGVYEVIAICRGRLVDAEPHHDRLERSLAALAITPPMSRRALAMIIGQVLARNRVDHGMIYLQITRGVAPRNHPFPSPAVRPTLMVTARHLPAPNRQRSGQGVDVISVPDIRWKRNNIKSVSLLANVLYKQQAREAGAYEAWMVDEDGWVTEGTASNSWFVTQTGEVVTRPLSERILAGITRATVMELALRAGLRVVERPFTIAEAKAGSEAFLTGTTSLVKPVVRIDGDGVGSGEPGPIAMRLLDLYLEHMERA